MKIITIASGSSANMTLIRTEKTNILVDIGIPSQRKIVAALQQQGLSIQDISVVFISHAHSDHLGYPGLKLLATNNIPIAAVPSAKNTIRHLFRKNTKIPFPDQLFVSLQDNACYLAGDLHITPFSVSHDIATFGFRIEHPKTGYRACMATDLGHAPPHLLPHFIDSDIILLEANYNQTLLQNSSRHPDSKARITSPQGHLSNQQAGEFLNQIGQASKKLPNTVVLVHLSKEHNTPQIAKQEVCQQAPWLRNVNLLTAPREGQA